MMYRKIIFSLFVLTLTGFQALQAQTNSGMDFLNIGPNATTLGLAEAQTALPAGASSIYTNPANLALENHSSLTADYTLWIGDSKITHAASNFLKGNQAFSIGVLSSSVQDIPARQQAGPSDGNFSVSYLSIAGGYALRVRNFSAGVTLQYLNEEYLANNASGYAVNLGLSSRWLSNRLRVSAAVLNMGRMDKLLETRTPLPTSFKVGAYAQVLEFSTPGSNDLPILISLMADAVQPLQNPDVREAPGAYTYQNDDFYMNFGTNINVADLFDFRFGYKTQQTARDISFGLGLTVDPIKFNYALVPFETGFGTVHSIGIEYTF